VISHTGGIADDTAPGSAIRAKRIPFPLRQRRSAEAGVSKTNEEVLLLFVHKKKTLLPAFQSPRTERRLIRMSKQTSTWQTSTWQPGELRTLGSISGAHLVSHFHMMVFPPLFVLLQARMGVDFIQLGLVITVFSVVSGLFQAPAGFAVDRFGARLVLLIGLLLGGGSFILFGLTLSYPWMLAAAAIAGLANCTYHPCDYAILSGGIGEKRMGRAFSIHTFAGYLGGALAPFAMLLMVNWLGLSGAIIAAGMLGPLAAIPLLLLRDAPAHEQAGRRTAPVSTRTLLTPAVVSLIVFFAMLAMSSSGISNFSVVALHQLWNVALGMANASLTAFLLASAFGVLAGGIIADRTARHGEVAAIGFAMSAALILIVGMLRLPDLALLATMGAAGFCSGIIMPSRDMLVRASAPKGAEGRVFGIVSTGFNIGGIFGPMLFGWVMDRGLPFWVFGGSVAFMLSTCVLALATERRPRPVAAE
jgi:MFS family permease